MKYMLLVHSEESDFLDRDTAAPELHPTFEFMANLNAELQASGELVDAAGLTAPSKAKTVRRRGKNVVLTDGPYAESKEVLGGYWVLELDSLERAVEIATRVVEFDGGPSPDAIEIRPME